MATLFFILLLISLVSLAVGLTKPSVFVRFIKKVPSRKQIALIFGGLAIASFIGIGSFAPSPAPENSITTQNVPEIVSQILKEKKGSKLLILSPVVVGEKGEQKQVLAKIKKDGFTGKEELEDILVDLF